MFQEDIPCGRGQTCTIYLTEGVETKETISYIESLWFEYYKHKFGYYKQKRIVAEMQDSNRYLDYLEEYFGDIV